MIINKAYKFRLYPNKAQEILINKTFGCVRFVYNKMLAERIETYEKFKDDKDELKKHKYSTLSSYKTEFEWLKEVDSIALSYAKYNLHIAYENFFRNKSFGLPKFKSKHKDKNSYTTSVTNKNIRIEKNKLRLPKLGFVRIKQHRQIPNDQTIKSFTISKSPSGKYFVSILVKYEIEIQNQIINTNNVIGLDMDMKYLFTDSQGNKAEYPRYYRQMLDKLATEQRKLSKCKIGSNNHNKQRLRVAKLHENVANQRKDFLHKLSRQVADNYDGVCIEDLDMRAMSQCLKLGKSVMDNGWGIFREFLSYKLALQGKPLIKIDKWYPSSKMCGVCGTINSDLILKNRIWTCDGCGTTHDRDYNAAINIRNQGISILMA